MAERYATVIKDNDGREVISNIALIEGKPEEPRGGAKMVKVPDGVKIGMVKGGKGEAADGWGFDIGGAKKAAKSKKDTETPDAAEQTPADGISQG